MKTKDFRNPQRQLEAAIFNPAVQLLPPEAELALARMVSIRTPELECPPCPCPCGGTAGGLRRIPGPRVTSPSCFRSRAPLAGASASRVKGERVPGGGGVRRLTGGGGAERRTLPVAEVVELTELRRESTLCIDVVGERGGNDGLA